MRKQPRTFGAQRGTIENAMSDAPIPDQGRPHVFSRFALHQSMKGMPSRKTRTIEFMRFVSVHCTFDDFRPARRVERSAHTRVAKYACACAVAIGNINRSAEATPRRERCDAPSSE
jgi:hypothetical protein